MKEVWRLKPVRAALKIRADMRLTAGETPRIAVENASAGTTSLQDSLRLLMDVRLPLGGGFWCGSCDDGDGESLYQQAERLTADDCLGDSGAYLEFLDMARQRVRRRRVGRL